jgi:cyclopropane fatty-acyl-phospholipid synthase-like methyltransferase
MVRAIETGLNLQPDDIVLDLACGNGALSRHLFGSCRGLVGVDFSEYLIEVAKTYFEQLPRYRFKLDDAAHFVQHTRNPKRFTKVLCYSSFSFFSQTDAGSVLGSLFRRFPNVGRVFLGNIPDKARAREFYGTAVNAVMLSDPTAQVGMWRTVPEITELAGQHGWGTTTSHMPEGFFNTSYRYDAVLHRPV